MSATLTLVHEAAQTLGAFSGPKTATVQAGHQVVSLAGDNGIPNPAPKAPPGAEKATSNIVAWTKWGSLIVIFLGAFIGAGALVGGKVAGHHKSASVGTSILLTCVIAIIVWGMIYGFFSGLLK